MRQSEGSVALIRREQDGQLFWLAQWNDHWKAYNFVAGHRHEGESFRECLIRELGEELGLRGGADYTIVVERSPPAEYSAWSESARAETKYTMALFDVELSVDARRRVGANPDNHWLSEGEIKGGHCRDGRPVSPTMRDLLIRAGIWAVSGR